MLKAASGNRTTCKSITRDSSVCSFFYIYAIYFIKVLICTTTFISNRYMHDRKCQNFASNRSNPTIQVPSLRIAFFISDNSVRQAFIFNTLDHVYACRVCVCLYGRLYPSVNSVSHDSLNDSFQIYCFDVTFMRLFYNALGLDLVQQPRQPFDNMTKSYLPHGSGC